MYILYISRGWAEFPVAGILFSPFFPPDEAVVDNKSRFQ